MIKIFPTILFVTVMLFSSYARADLIGVGFDSQNSPVVRIDEVTGDFLLVGLSGFSGLNSLANNTSGVFYSAEDLTGTTPQLITVDPSTGAGSLVAVLNFGSIAPDLRGLAFSPSDVLYAINNTGPGGGLNPDDLFTINASNGVGTLIGATGLTGVQALAFSPSGTLYGWDIDSGLVTIDPLTGVATDTNPGVGATGEIQGITFAPNGTLFGARNALFTIDVTTGSPTQIGSGGGFDVRGIAITSPIPEPSTWLLLGSGLVGLVLWRRRRLSITSQ